MLDFSKLDAEKMVLQHEAFDFEGALNEVVMLLQPALQDKEVQIIVDYDMFLPTHFIGDVGRLRQVLTNLIGNAVKFTSKGCVLVRVVGVFDPVANKTRLHVSVQDTGIGIPADKQVHVFGEFNQVDDARNRSYEGTGLGLSISQKLIRMMGGEIWVESEEGVGSTFGFKVELATEAQADTSTWKALEGRALVLEPSDLIADTAQKQLSRLGLSAERCATASDAIGSLGEDVFVVLADSAMVGFDLLPALEAAGYKGRVILTSAQLGMYQQQGDNGLDVHELLKPLVTRQLAEKLCLAAPRTEEVASVAADVVEANGKKRKMRVLAAEDNKTNQLVFRKMVKALDIDLKFAGNGREAVELYQSFEPDLVFMDISMPEMDGKEATRAIRTLEAESGKHVPVLALTAHAMGGDKEEIMSAGMDQFLTKPLRKAEIYAAIGGYQPKGVQPVRADEAAA